MKTATATFLALLLPGLAWMASCASPAENSLSDPQQLELRTFRAQVGEADRSAKTRIEAAEMLLAKNLPAADAILVDFLGDAKNPAAQIAVAEAIANHPGGREIFVQPLEKMLTGPEPSVRPAAGRALASYKDHGATERLAAIARDARRDRDIRLVAIQSLQRVLDKRAVDALVRLLRSDDDGLRNAAGESLADLTNIRHFGADPGLWETWWRQNRDRKELEWLGDLAYGLAQSNAALEAENTRLRERLGKAMSDLYASTAPAQRDAMLLRLLKDPLADVRLAATTIASRRIDAEEPLSADVAVQVRLLLADSDAEVRKAAAMLTARLGEADAVDALLERLKIEESPAVRQGLLRAMGQLREGKALPAILEKIAQRQYEGVSASAAGALARTVEKQPLEGELREQAVAALTARFTQASDAGDGVALREALVTAMGAVKDKAHLPALQKALKDPAATVRLAGVNAIAQFGDEALSAYLVPLAGDGDRGVRQAAVAALGALGGGEHLDTILQRSDPFVEGDATVRERAWAVTMSVLARSDAKTLLAVSRKLAERKDSPRRREQVLALLVKALQAGGSPELPSVLREYGVLLMGAQRPAEAAPLLGQAYAALAAKKDPNARAAWSDWIDSLLATWDSAVVKALAEQEDAMAFADGLARLRGRIDAAQKEERLAAAAALAEAAARDLAPRLTVAERKDLEKIAAGARAQSADADRRKAEPWIRQLSGDAAARPAAVSALQAMGPSAAPPLLDALTELLAAGPIDSAVEGAILSVLHQIAPALTGYDPAAAQAERRKVVQSWRGGTTQP